MCQQVQDKGVGKDKKWLLVTAAATAQWLKVDYDQVSPRFDPVGCISGSSARTDHAIGTFSIGVRVVGFTDIA